MKSFINLNFNRIKIEGCTAYNGLSCFGKHNKQKGTWSVGCNSPSTVCEKYLMKRIMKQINRGIECSLNYLDMRYLLQGIKIFQLQPSSLSPETRVCLG